MDSSYYYKSDFNVISVDYSSAKLSALVQWVGLFQQTLPIFWMMLYSKVWVKPQNASKKSAYIKNTVLKPTFLELKKLGGCITRNTEEQNSQQNMDKCTCAKHMLASFPGFSTIVESLRSSTDWWWLKWPLVVPVSMCKAAALGGMVGPQTYADMDGKQNSRLQLVLFPDIQSMENGISF